MIKKILILCFAIIALSACVRTRYIERTTHQQSTDTLRELRERIDSIYIRDSTYHYIYTAGDTVYNTLYKERTRWREVKQVDTFYQHRVDTLRVSIKTKEQTNTKDWGGWLILLLAISVIAIICGVLKKG